MTHINEAGIAGLFKMILYILAFYYISKFLMKLFGPYLLKKAVNKVQKKAEQQFNNQQQQQQQNDVETGKTVVDKKPQNIQQSNNSVGEYVDFEEID
ncbi:DUF4834 family protein [Tenacibaculum dicentrarchi]|uniref:DUF4834 domain-containing protein n=1 Tax=Tenacibaculum dicentrarchi TaxID=669041 RepID=A0ABM9NYU6_9FLAO|nr:DUF4834 family protein [Tenacibaculum dicentrarchi]MCD8406350.1 DUF4834 family protein [Tenacibaculum dicentrarchi]MCD8415328.1 DUF4834 family protein [Tenacibaculum dicentrarchi]MCD8420570.1 DUF4834 family protein [Tenacibaculum dicentrarchi]MCD8423719.1 DUF4834 family protein [Tenacibaculum dicentrarchi]